MKKIFILCTLLLSLYQAQTHGMFDGFLLTECARKNEVYLKGFTGCSECMVLTPRITHIDGNAKHYENIYNGLAAHINTEHRSINTYEHIDRALNWWKCTLCGKLGEEYAIRTHLCPEFRPPIKALDPHPEQLSSLNQQIDAA